MKKLTEVSRMSPLASVTIKPPPSLAFTSNADNG